jgi:hypothetical protein
MEKLNGSSANETKPRELLTGIWFSRGGGNHPENPWLAPDSLPFFAESTAFQQQSFF